MMRSLYSAFSGLQNHQTRMDVIGNNISNVNTVGFKASRVKFQDVFSQTLQGASGATGTLGGTNPVQIGMGVGVASIDTVFTDGSLQTTGKQTDLAISGKGFFVLSDGIDQVYTRAGGFDFDTAGNFIVPGTGYKVQGWSADSTGAINTSSTAGDIKIPGGTQMPAKVTTGIDYTNNLSASDAIGTTIVSSTNVYDSLGNPQKVNQTFVKESDNTWLASTAVPNSTVTAGGLTKITFTKDGILKDISTITVTPIPTAAVRIPDGTATNPTLQLNNTLSSTNKSVYTVFDKDNIPHEVQVLFTNTAPNQWSYSVTDQANPNAAELTRGTTTYTGTSPTGSYSNFPISFTLAGTTNPITINAPSPASQKDPKGTAGGVLAGVSNGFANITALQLNCTDTPAPISAVVTDSDGKTHNLAITFTNTGANKWGYVIKETLITPATASSATTIGADVTGSMTYDPTNGYSPLSEFTAITGKTVAFTIVSASAVAPNYTTSTVAAGTSPYTTGSTQIPLRFIPTGGADAVTLDMNMGTLTQYGGSSAVVVEQDGYATGSLESTSINTSGVIIGQFSNGQILSLAQVALANFNNPSGLTKTGDSLYVKSTNSGEPLVGAANTSGLGGFNSGSLEISNVDLAQQFSDMIVTQRGFQANSKIITTTDTMLEELINLKR